MKYCRFKQNNKIFSGILKNNIIFKINGSFFTEFEVTEEKFCIDDVELLTPIIPKKIVGVGKNYAAHAAELNSEVPSVPCLFLKPVTAILHHEGYIVKPKFVTRLDYEGELAVVIKKTCKNISQEEAKDYILGYTCLNDVTARDIQQSDGQWIRAKGMDTFAPFGPIISDEVNPLNLNIETRLNDKIKQKSNTNTMIFNVYNLVSFISENFTLEAGDLIATGTPEGIGPMISGDNVCVTIEGIGTLKNYVK